MSKWDDSEDSESDGDARNAYASGGAALYTWAGHQKAGMSSQAMDAIRKVVDAQDTNSAYYRHAKSQDLKTTARVEEIQQGVRRLSNVERRNNLTRADEAITSWKRDLSRVHVVFDLDAFFASVEEKLDPSLKNTAFAVGSRRSVLSTSSYEARKFGVRAAMPGFTALKLCPHLNIVSSSMGIYKRESAAVRDVLENTFGLDVSAASLDEFYVELDNADHTLTTIEGVRKVDALVSKVRSEIFKQTQLTISAGIACTPMLAKISADVRKPDGQTSNLATEENMVATMFKLSPRRIPGIGKVSNKILTLGFGVCDMRDVFLKRDEIHALMSKRSFEFFLRAALGLTRVERSGGVAFASESSLIRKSISRERTFALGESNETVLKSKLKSICEKLINDMERANTLGRKVSVKIKTSEFVVKTRDRSLKGDVVGTSVELLFKHAWELLLNELPLSLRLMGVKVSNLLDNDGRVNVVEASSLKTQARLEDLKAPKTFMKMTCVNCPKQFTSLRALNEHLNSCLSLPSPKRTKRDDITSYFSTLRRE